MKFKVFPEHAGFNAALVSTIVELCLLLALVWLGKMTTLGMLVYFAVVVVLFFIVWDVTAYIAAWFQLDPEQFKRFVELRPNLLQLFD